MGSINKHDLNNYINNYHLNIFVETGTGIGNSFQHAQKFNFKNLFTIEMIPELHGFASSKYDREDSFFILGTSRDGLKDALDRISKEDNILFWLDAHFPGADFGLTPYTSTTDSKIRIPLQEELEVIVSQRDIKNDVVIIDDLRIYEDGPFEDGNWSERNTLGGNGIEFIYNLFSKTHSINRDYRDQGYIILTPKKRSALELILCTK